jgi:hypothetical protein
MTYVIGGVVDALAEYICQDTQLTQKSSYERDRRHPLKFKLRSRSLMTIPGCLKCTSELGIIAETVVYH